MKIQTFRKALDEARQRALQNDPDLILLGEKTENPQSYATPLSEATIVGTGIGLALSGLKAIVQVSSSDLSLLTLEMLFNHAAKYNFLSGGKTPVPLILEIPNGYRRGLGPVASQNFESLFTGLAGLTVVSPTTPAQAVGLFNSALELEEPVVFLENRALFDTAGAVPSGDYTERLYRAKIEQEGSDLTIVSWGPALLQVKSLTGLLEREGISVEIINPLTLYPMDLKTIFDSVIKTSRLVIVHDGAKVGGIGADIAAAVIESPCFDYLDAPILRVGGADTPTYFNDEAGGEIGKKEILKAIYEVIGLS